MLKDIEFLKIKDVSMAAVLEKINQTEQWVIYIINKKKVPLKNVLVVSKGYGTTQNKKVETTKLRKFFEEIPKESSQQVEPIIDEVLSITNEYWLSFYVKDKVFDKKFTFLPNTISKQHLVNIPLINQKGVLHP